MHKVTFSFMPFPPRLLATVLTLSLIGSPSPELAKKALNFEEP